MSYGMPIVEWPNILSEPNYSEIVDEREILPLRKETHAETIATESMKCVIGKYEIAMPFQNTETNELNNFRTAKKRLVNQRSLLMMQIGQISTSRK